VVDFFQLILTKSKKCNIKRTIKIGSSEPKLSKNRPPGVW